MTKVLDIKDLYVSFDTYAGEVQAVRGVSYSVDEGQVLAVVGESGCGKSVTAQTIMKLNPMPPARIKYGTLTLGDIDIINTPEEDMQKIRGKEVSMIFQDPMTCLNPTMKVGKQIVEAIVHHQHLSKEEAQKKAIEMLKLVQIPNAEERANQYPHQFSGGMRQRAMIAMALSCNPKLLIADEPTTALDVTIQAQILEVLKELQGELGTSIILISHDIGVVANCCQRIQVMYGGVIVESARTENLIQHPLHPYTQGLLSIVSNLTEGESEYLPSIEGAPPQLVSPPSGCPFAERCGYAMKICTISMPEFNGDKEHMVRCWRYDERNPKKVRCDS